MKICLYSVCLALLAAWPAAAVKTNSTAAAVSEQKQSVEVPVKDGDVNPVAENEPKENLTDDQKDPEKEAMEERRLEREQRRDKRSPPVEAFVDSEGWQSGVGYKAMEQYVKRLSLLCRERLPGMVTGVAGGKKGILLQVTFKAKRNFYLAQENTKEFLTAIVKDLEKLPEPVAAQVIMNHNGQQIISAERKGKDVKVNYLL